MYKVKFVVAILFITLIGNELLTAQNAISSPYSRFGFGELNSTSLSAARSMGGVGIGFRNKGVINPTNPASFTNIDTLSFAFEVGASGRYSKLKSNSASQSDFKGNFDYVVGQFPLCRWAGMSFGMLPYSAVGYDYSIEKKLPANTAQNPTAKDYVFSQSYEGEGGINQIFVGAAAKPIKCLSVGVNFYYLFGNIDHYRESVLTSETGHTAFQSSNLHIKDFRFRYGIQYFQPINEKNEIVVGAVYENRSKVNGDYKFISCLSLVSADTVNTSYGFEFPEMLGFGVCYIFDKKLTLAFDYSLTKWSGARYYGVRDSLKNESKFTFGAEYLPDLYGKKFYQRMRYRVGATYTDSYISKIDDYAKITATVGVGLPVRHNTSYLNIGFEYGHFGALSSSVDALKENYYKLSLGIVLVERWFMKRQIK